MTSSTRYETGGLSESDPADAIAEDGDESPDELFSAFTTIVGFAGLFVLGVVGCIVAAALAG